MNKKPAPVPNSVPYKYVGKDRINNFHVGQNAMRRLVSESYKAGARNHKVPTTSSPLMLTSALSNDEKTNETHNYEKVLHHFRNKTDYILQNQGPSVLPLSGSGGSPIRLARS